MSRLERKTASGLMMSMLVLGAWTVSPALGADAACQQQAQTLCSGAKPGEAKFDTCLKEHAADLSKDCLAQLQASVARANELKEFPSCIADAEKLCPGSKPGGGQIMACLRVRQEDISEECKREMGKVTGQY